MNSLSSGPPIQGVFQGKRKEKVYSTVLRSSFRRPISSLQRLWLAGGALLLLLVCWEVMVSLRLLPSDYVASPFSVFSGTIDLFVSHGLLTDLLASAGRISLAFAISSILAVPLGFLMSSFRKLNAMVEPVVSFVRYVPVPALLPVFVLFAGIGEAPKFLVLFFGTFFQLVLLIRDEADHVDEVYFEIARTLGANTWAQIRDVLVPKTAPKIYDHLRVTLGWCWTYLVIAELIAVQFGIGHVIKESQRFNNAVDLISCCLILGLIGLLTDTLLESLYPVLFPHRPRR